MRNENGNQRKQGRSGHFQNTNRVTNDNDRNCAKTKHRKCWFTYYRYAKPDERAQKVGFDPAESQNPGFFSDRRYYQGDIDDAPNQTIRRKRQVDKVANQDGGENLQHIWRVI